MDALAAAAAVVAMSVDDYAKAELQHSVHSVPRCCTPRHPCPLNLELPARNPAPKRPQPLSPDVFAGVDEAGAEAEA